MKKVRKPGCPSEKRRNPKWLPVGVKIEVFDLFSYFGLYFLAESVLLDGFHAKEFIFGGFVEFQFFVFAKWSILLKNKCGGVFQFYAQILT